MSMSIRIVFLVLVGVFVGCTSSGSSGTDAVDSAGATSDAADGKMCTLLYRQPGCSGNVTAVCDDGRGGACGGAVCDCHGMVRSSFCDRADVPFAYFLAPGTDVFGPDAALTCDPTNADAALSH